MMLMLSNSAVAVETLTISTSENLCPHNNRADRIATGYTGQLFLCLYNLAEKIPILLYFTFKKRKYMEAGLYQRLIEKCKSEEAKKSIQERYGFLIDQN